MIYNPIFDCHIPLVSLICSAVFVIVSAYDLKLIYIIQKMNIEMSSIYFVKNAPATKNNCKCMVVMLVEGVPSLPTRAK